MLPPTHDGPLVSGRPTIVTTLSVGELSASTYLPSLFRLVNAAFDDIHLRLLPPIAGGYPRRLNSVEEIVPSLRNNPQSFTFIICFTDAPEEALATASCRPYTSLDDGPGSEWVRRLGPEEGCVEWEYMMLAVEPKYQGQGLASYLTRKTEEEAVSRSKAALADAAQAHGEPDDKAIAKCVRMVLNGLKETTNEFYARRGYKNDYEVPGVGGFPITLVSKSKVIAEL